MPRPELTDRERRVLEAVIQSYVETAQPAGSQAIARRFGLGVSAATIRNTMSDLEAKGFLFHPHTSAGRIPTDVAYRVYVDSLLSSQQPLDLHIPDAPDIQRLTTDIASGDSAIEHILRRAAESLGVITQELGVALGPAFDRSVLQQLDLIRLAADRLLVVLTLDGAAMRTIFVEARGAVADSAIAEVARVLNERLVGLTLQEVRSTLSTRLRDSTPMRAATELLNIFLEESEQLFDAGVTPGASILLGQASVLADQPEFASADAMRRLVELTEKRQQLGELLRHRSGASGISITIGNEHEDPRLDSFTMITAQYHVGALSGVIGVIGPTRMPYDKVISLVSHTSRLITDLLD